MASTQQGDVLLFQTVNDGDISVVNGVVEMTAGFETAAYVSLFGGNIEDDGTAANALTWWGNLDETEPAKKYVSETQHLLDLLPPTSSNLLKLEAAASRDLQWFTDENIASSVTVVVTIPALNAVNFDIKILAEGQETSFNFTENWKAAA